MKKQYLFVAAAAIQIMALLVIAVRYELVDRYGAEVLVPAFGYDPTDLFRWDYVSLTYGPVSSWTGALDFKPESWMKVFVSPEMSSTGTFVAIKSVTRSQPDEMSIRATVGNYRFWQPEYRYESLPTSSAVPISGTFVNEFEYPYADSQNPDLAIAKFAVGSGAIAALTDTWSLIGLYADLNECASGLESNSWSVKAVAMPATDNVAYEVRQKEYREKCRSFPQVAVRSVFVPRILDIDYSADRFFIEEDTWRPIEASIAKGGVLAIWKVSKSSGKVVLHGLKIWDSVIR